MQASAAQPDAELIIEQGLQSLAEGKNEEALGFFVRAIDTAPERADAWACHGIALARLDRHADSAGSLQQSVSLDPTAAEVWQFLGDALFQLERMGEAVRPSEVHRNRPFERRGMEPDVGGVPDTPRQCQSDRSS